MKLYFYPLIMLTLILSNECFGQEKSEPVQKSNNNHYLDNALKDAQTIKNNIDKGGEVFHLFSHGKSGKLLIEGQWQNTEEIAAWLKENYNLNNYTGINIYGCEFGKGTEGQLAIQYLTNQLGLSVAASDDITGIDGDWDLEIGEPNCVLSLSKYNYNLQTCTNGAFTWDNGSGGGQVFPTNSQSESYTLNAGGPLGVTLEIIDPHNLNADDDYAVAGSHPFDPTGGCTSLADWNGQVGPLTNPFLDCEETFDNVSGQGSIWDPWDSDCGLDPTQTNGVYGLDYLTIWMRSVNSDQEVEYRFTFDRPVNIEDFRISDIDAIGFFGDDICDLERLGNSYQDQVRLAATDLCGEPVALDIQSSTSQPSSQQIIDPVTQTSYSEYNINQNNNISPGNQDGEIIVNSTKPVTTFSIFYSNGPDDKAWEEANASDYPWWSNTNGATSGVSDDHAIRIDGFDFCACPELNIAVTGSACENDASATYNVTSDYTISKLFIDGVEQASTNSFTVSPPANATYEVIVEAPNGCKDSYSFVTVLDAAPAVSSIQGTDPTCAGNDGSIDLTVTSATAYTVDWDNIAGTDNPENQTGLAAGTYNVTITNVDGCSVTSSVTLVAPECSVPALRLGKTVDAATAILGQTVTFTLTVYNDGTEELTNVEVTDVLPTGLSYTGDNSGGSYDSGTGVWAIPSIAIGDSAVIEIMTTMDVEGVIVNEAEITASDQLGSDPDITDNTDKACVSVPIEVCDNEAIDIDIIAATGYTSYQWYKDGVLIAGATTDTYKATEAGVYTYTVDGAGPTGDCEGELCCPVVIEQVSCCPDIQCLPITVTKLEE